MFEVASVSLNGAVQSTKVIEAVADTSSRLDRKKQRNELCTWAVRILRLDVWIAIGAARLQGRLEEGTGWEGGDKWPVSLTGGVIYLSGIATELDEIAARVRAVDDDHPSIARFRDDLEALCALERFAAVNYLAGTQAAHIHSRGRPVCREVGVGARTATLTDIDISVHRDVARQATLLLRTCLHRSESPFADAYVQAWPIRADDINKGMEIRARGPVVHPIDWVEPIDMDAMNHW